MASQESSVSLVQANKIQCNQQSKVLNAENSWEYGKVPLSESLKLVELEVLEKDLSEFIHLNSHCKETNGERGYTKGH